MAHNILDEKIITIRPLFSKRRKDEQKVNLPQLMYWLCQKDSINLPKLSEINRSAFISFVSYLMALCVLELGHTSSEISTPEHLETISEDDWRKALRSLVGIHADTAFDLIVADTTKPAFLQPATDLPLQRQDQKDTPILTPDDLTVLVTSKNWIVKRSKSDATDLEQWLYAIIMIQMSADYLGSWFNTIKMTTGEASRVYVHIVKDLTMNTLVVSNVGCLLRQQDEITKSIGFSVAKDSHKLLWLIQRNKATQISLKDCHAFFIDCPRTYRFEKASNGVVAVLGVSNKAGQIRIPLLFEELKTARGVVGDVNTPIKKITRKGKGKSEQETYFEALVMNERGFHARLLLDILENQKIKSPMITDFMSRSDGFESGFLYCSALAGGKGKTHGFHTRVLALNNQFVNRWSEDDEKDTNRLHMITHRYLKNASDFFENLVNKPIKLVLQNSGRGESFPINKFFGTDKKGRIIGEGELLWYERKIDSIFFDYLTRRFACDTIESELDVDTHWFNTLDEITTQIRNRIFNRCFNDETLRLKSIGILAAETYKQQQFLKSNFNITNWRTPNIPMEMINAYKDFTNKFASPINKAFNYIVEQNQKNNKSFTAKLRNKNTSPSMNPSFMDLVEKSFGKSLLTLQQYHNWGERDIKFWSFLFGWMSTANDRLTKKVRLAEALTRIDIKDIPLQQLLTSSHSDGALLKILGSNLQYFKSIGVDSNRISWVDVAVLLFSNGSDQSKHIRDYFACSIRNIKFIANQQTTNTGLEATTLTSTEKEDSNG